MGKPRPEFAASDPVASGALDLCQPQLGDQLKRMFGDVTAGPMPDRLLELADALEEAFQRGELFDKGRRRPRAS